MKEDIRQLEIKETEKVTGGDYPFPIKEKKCPKYQLKHRLKVCIGTLVERTAAADLLYDILSLYLHKLRRHGEKVIK